MPKKSVPKFIYVKTQAELWQELLEQFDALQTHGASYDAGKVWQAKTLASTIYTLLKDGGQPNSWVKPLLETLKLRTTIQYLDTRKPMMFQENSTCMAPLTWVEFTQNEARYVPLCRLSTSSLWHRTVSFRKWWDGDVLQTSRGKRISRARLVDRVRSSDGGGHSDPDIRHEDYQDARSDFEPRQRWVKDGISAPIPNVHLATVRQIAWELEQSLKDIVIAAPPLSESLNG